MPLDLRSHFLHSLDALQDASSYESQQFTLIASSKILRDLLLENTLKRVGRVLGRHPRFDVPKADHLKMPEGLEPDYYYAPYALDPRSDARPRQTELVTLDRFTALPIFTLDGTTYPVKTVVKVAANGLGGVHFDHIRPSEVLGRQLLEADRQMFLDGKHAEVSQVAAAIRQIGIATVHACALMRLQVLARTEL